jgi:phospholipid/cholesterol/gamma-HCH transport system substrate-binding protein
VWIAGEELFTVAPDGSQELTAQGRKVLDQSMSKLTPYLPNNPIMVEGYSTSGLPDQQYLASRQRAVAVRQYLVSRFHLNPKWIGVMPLGHHPPAKTDKKTWDGVCLVLVVSEKQN